MNFRTKDLVVPVVDRSIEAICSDHFYNVVRAVRALPTENQDRLLLFCCNLDKQLLNKEEMLRIGIVRVMCALLPKSLETLTNWLFDHRLHELHFTVFCYVDFVSDDNTAYSYRGQVLQAVENYLLNVREETACAAWMAGDLLGDHWSLTDALPVLLRAVSQARYVAGRKAALSGLNTLLKSPSLSAENLRVVFDTLKRQASVERSALLRLRINALLIDKCVSKQ